MTTTYASDLRKPTKGRSAVDWCTTTTKSDDASRATWELGSRLLDASRLEGEEPTRWHAYGYRGWSVPGCALGARQDGVQLRLSSAKAAKNWQDAIATAENCTRFDLCTDLYFDAPVMGLAQKSYLKSARHRVSNGRPPGRRLIVSWDGGSTFYTGSRASTRMGRLYDKGVEQRAHAPGLWWRWELEFKAESAVALSDAARARGGDMRWMHATVSTFFVQRGAIAPSRSMVSVISNEHQIESTDDQLLSWLAVGVRPTVARLLDRVGRERVTFCLGLAPKSAVS